MNYLVDANVLSEATKPVPDPGVVAWLADNEAHFFVNPIILGELSIGIMALSRGRKRDRLESWFNTITETIACVPWEAITSAYWAKLVVDLRKAGKTMPLLDGMIAATAMEHDLTIATRNTRDFAPAGIKVVNPFGKHQHE